MTLRKLHTRIARLHLHHAPKNNPFAVFIDDEEGFYLRRLKKEIKKYPKLKELDLESLLSKRLSQSKEGDIIIFGDSEAPLQYDYRVVELPDLISIGGIEELELTEDWNKVKKALKKYHKSNYPKEHNLLRKKQQAKARYYSPPQYAYYSRSTGRKVDGSALRLEIPRAVLGRYEQPTIKITIPKTSSKKDVIIGRKKKINKEKYVVHQNFVKVGLKGYNIYHDRKNNEYVNIKGTTYEVFRRPGKKAFLVE